MPAIDGLRALAVAGVVMFHLPAMQMVGGYLGVDLFLVISGYLITALLLAEVAATGRIGLGAFWMRRLRRLVPALALMLAGTVTWMALVDWTLVHRARTMLLASLGYVTNWYQAAVPYLPWDPASRPGAYEHLWSLAVEEQFYLVWPLVLAALLVVVGIRRRTLMAGVVAGALASAALAWVLFDAGVDTARIYYGTDTRVVALLVGIALAVALPPARFTAWRPSGVAGTLLDIAGPVALVAVVGMFMAFSQVGGALFHGGFLLIALVAAVLLIAAAHPSTPTARLFSLAPLVWIGARSYGIYLWHLPVITLFTPDLGAPVDGAWLAALQVLMTVTIAALSYRFVEMPIRRRGFRAVIPRRASGRAVVGATAALAVVAIVVTVVLAPGPGAGVAMPVGVAPGIVVVSLGTDRPMTAADVRTLMGAAPPGVPVVRGTLGAMG